jgi:hypothetical protein
MMKMKKFAAAAAGLMLALSAAGAVCAVADYEAEKQAVGGKPTFEKYLVMDSTAAVPNASFVFTVAPAAKPVDSVGDITLFDGIAGAKFAEGEGVTVGKDGKATVTFSPADETTQDVNAGTRTVMFADTENNNEKFAVKTITLDFSEVHFPNPGIYCYQITEEAPTSAGITNVSGTEYLYYVTVTDTNGTLSVDSYILQQGTSAPEIENVGETNDPEDAGKKNSKKSTGITNRYTTHSLDFNKLVDGNQGSRDKYFKFTLKLTDPAEGEAGHINVNDDDRYIIDAANSDFDPAPEGNIATVYTAENMTAANSVDIHTDTDADYQYLTYSELAAGKTFYLHSNQNIKILGIPEGLGYEITEDEENYTPSVTVHTDDGLDSDGTVDEANNKVTDAALTADAEITFTNVRNGVIPTGILSTTATSAGIVAGGLAGIISSVLYLKKKRSEDQ